MVAQVHVIFQSSSQLALSICRFNKKWESWLCFIKLSQLIWEQRSTNGWDLGRVRVWRHYCDRFQHGQNTRRWTMIQFVNRPVYPVNLTGDEDYIGKYLWLFLFAHSYCMFGRVCLHLTSSLTVTQTRFHGSKKWSFCRWAANRKYWHSCFPIRRLFDSLSQNLLHVSLIPLYDSLRPPFSNSVILLSSTSVVFSSIPPSVPLHRFYQVKECVTPVSS